MDRPLGPDGKPIPTQEEIVIQVQAYLRPLETLISTMKDKFNARAYKGGWRGRMDLDKAWDELFDELSELRHELFEPPLVNSLDLKPHGQPRNTIDYNKVLKECADVANQLVILADLVKEMQENAVLTP